MNTPDERAASLQSSMHDIGLELLRPEIRTANVVLDAIDVSRNHEARARRLRIAWEAHDVVLRHLDADVLLLTAAESDGLRSDLGELRERLDPA